MSEDGTEYDGPGSATCRVMPRVEFWASCDRGGTQVPAWVDTRVTLFSTGRISGGGENLCAISRKEQAEKKNPGEGAQISQRELCFPRLARCPISRLRLLCTRSAPSIIRFPLSVYSPRNVNVCWLTFTSSGPESDFSLFSLCAIFFSLFFSLLPYANNAAREGSARRPYLS